MNDTDKILDTLTTRLQQSARIEDEEAMADLIMNRIDEAESAPQSRRIPQLGWLVPLRVAASVAVLFFVGLFLLLSAQQPGKVCSEVCSVHNIEQYQIILEQNNKALEDLKEKLVIL